MEQEEIDLIVIGSGPAGEKGAAQAAYFKKRVVLVEREAALGGAAANTGTLPSKTLRETALFLSGFRNRALEGLDFRGLKAQMTIPDLMTRKQVIVDKERQRIQANLERHQVPVVRGTASFIDPHTVGVRSSDGATRRLRGRFVLIATGSYPFRPPHLNFADPRVHDSDSILTLREIPKSILVLGGGVIGCEYACMFGILGIQVHLVEKRDRLLTFLDGEISASLQKQMQTLGVRLYLSNGVKKIDYGPDTISAQLESGETLQVDNVLVSSGRCGNVQGLNLDKVGIKADDRGRIDVNESYQTSVPHIYAAGDVIGQQSLASTSMEQARVAMVHAFGLEYLPGKAKKAVATILPYGIYTIPECSMAGDTEEDLRKKGVAYVAGRARYRDNARGQIIGDSEGFVKLLFRADDMKLLGVHVIGEQATEIVHVGLTALIAEASADLFIRTCFNYPTLTEAYKYATYDALGQRDRLAK